MPQVELGRGRGAKNSVSFGLAPGQPPSMKPTPELVELPRDRQLVGDREVEPLLLRAVAQGGVVDVERALQVHRVRPGARAVPVLPANKKDPPSGQEVCASGSARRAR